MGRTLVVTSTFPSSEEDPRGGFIRRYWESRAASGEHVEVLAPWTRAVDSSGALAGPLRVTRFHYAPRACATLSGGFGILENMRARPHRAALVPPFLVAMRRALRERVAAGAFDRVAAHMVVPCGVVAGLALADADARLDVYGHGTDVDILLARSPVLRSLIAAPLRRASAIHLPSKDKLARFEASLPALAGRCQVATMRETVVREVIERRPIPGRILFLGRLIQQKGVDDLIRAVADLRGGAHLHIAGDGPERGRLASLAARMGVQAVFHGFVSGSRKREVLTAATVICVPSREVRGLSEGAPLVVSEATSLGIPVVATRVGGIPELADDGELVTLVAPGDRAALRAALARHVLAA